MSSLTQRLSVWTLTQKLTNAIENSPDKEAVVKDIEGLISICREYTAKYPKHEELNRWCNMVGKYVRSKKRENGFINGNKAHNSKQKNLLPWLLVGRLGVSVTSSPNLKTHFARHHASANERNTTLIYELETALQNVIWRNNQMCSSDIFNAVCPHCTKNNVIKSKAGRCEGAEYDVTNAPLKVLGDVVEIAQESKGIACEHCKKKFAVRVQLKTTIIPIDDPENNFRIIE
ncbi:hypothetical protein [Vibrio sp. D431a]|uniref:hypothetical protein n=1 Tax=Vibrio sp. D431a TaxID=2837388 RepID=UPI002557A2A5|nr:hypothetical protein [Vibrio sp. D431a]MDK9789773.1 hypothetical protein [Vibrio sp. D431a]